MNGHMNPQQRHHSNHNPQRNATFSAVLTACLAVFLVGCGTTSKLKSAPGSSLSGISKYTQVSVMEFADQSQKGKTGVSATVGGSGERGRHFADLVATEIEKTRAFEKVERLETPTPGSLVVGGEITRCAEGNASLRFWIGLGAGSSYFDAVVRTTDADTHATLGEIKVDKNSWALGGGIAAGQTVESFMQGAAQKVADQLSKAKRGHADSRQSP
jgi:hypothetical protein